MQVLKSVFVLGIIGLVVYIFYFAGDVDKKPTDYCDDSWDARHKAYAMAEYFVSERLLDPDTAKFSSWTESTVKHMDYCKFYVTGTVRATNTFGAYIKNNYSMNLEYKKNDKHYYATNIKM